MNKNNPITNAVNDHELLKKNFIYMYIYIYVHCIYIYIVYMKKRFSFSLKLFQLFTSGVKWALRPSNAKRLYMDEKSTKIGKLISRRIGK